ncbi:hypothetical protein EVAR_56811_1 [Eumeta japonica]|uniref:Uncharacterized protein n=1 Tax=Eumeta variegata TaxID=151549 RepID=A0A4C1Y402_EUMVA|nr:hypothetical protein EVAR_56811_1 [Eumeta japonica]
MRSDKRIYLKTPPAADRVLTRRVHTGAHVRPSDRRRAGPLMPFFLWSAAAEGVQLRKSYFPADAACQRPHR